VSFPEGDTLPAAAKWSALLNTQYRVRGGALNGLELGANVSYTSSRPYVLPNTSELASYVRTDLFANWEVSPAFSVQMNLNNVTDERIVLANGYGRAQFDTPRSVALVVRYHAGAARVGK
jgi:outer membrane receptor protein involved in Fe transport